MNDLEIKNIVDELSSLADKSLKLYTSIVANIIQNNLKDEKYIEKTLDGLLDLCFDNNGLLLYKKVCKHYFNINPQATVEYINYYRDMYEEGKKQ